MMVFKRPIVVWVMALFFGVPALFFIIIHTLVLNGYISPPIHMQAYFENLDRVYLLINGAEALILLACIGILLAMKRISAPLFTVYFSIDTLHELSGKYLYEKETPLSLATTVLINIAVVTYVWNLRRKNLLK